MPISRTTIAGSLAGVALLLSAGAALATPGQATASVNVRSGPGTSYGIVDSLAPGEPVDVQQCRGSWCYVQHSGPSGWVSANFLSTGSAPSGPPVYYDDEPPPVYYDEPEYLPPPVIYDDGPIYRSRPYYYNHRRPPNMGGQGPGRPPFHNPPPNHNPPPVVHSGNGGPFNAGRPAARPPQNICATDPQQCQNNNNSHGNGPFGSR